jgi:hypothetical protein
MSFQMQINVKNRYEKYFFYEHHEVYVQDHK